MNRKLKNNNQGPREYNDNRSHWHNHTIITHVPETRRNTALIKVVENI